MHQTKLILSKNDKITLTFQIATDRDITWQGNTNNFTYFLY